MTNLFAVLTTSFHSVLERIVLVSNGLAQSSMVTRNPSWRIVTRLLNFSMIYRKHLVVLRKGQMLWTSLHVLLVLLNNPQPQHQVVQPYGVSWRLHVPPRLHILLNNIQPQHRVLVPPCDVMTPYMQTTPSKALNSESLNQKTTHRLKRPRIYQDDDMGISPESNKISSVKRPRTYKDLGFIDLSNSDGRNCVIQGADLGLQTQGDLWLDFGFGLILRRAM